MSNSEKIAFFDNYMQFINNFNYLDHADTEELTQVFIDFMDLEFKKYIEFLTSNFIDNNEFTSADIAILHNIIITMKQFTI